MEPSFSALASPHVFGLALSSVTLGSILASSFSFFFFSPTVKARLLVSYLILMNLLLTATDYQKSYQVLVLHAGDSFYALDRFFKDWTEPMILTAIVGVVQIFYIHRAYKFSHDKYFYFRCLNNRTYLILAIPILLLSVAGSLFAAIHATGITNVKDARWSVIAWAASAGLTDIMSSSILCFTIHSIRKGVEKKRSRAFIFAKTLLFYASGTGILLTLLAVSAGGLALFQKIPVFVIFLDLIPRIGSLSVIITMNLSAEAHRPVVETQVQSQKLFQPSLFKEQLGWVGISDVESGESENSINHSESERGKGKGKARMEEV